MQAAAPSLPEVGNEKKERVGIAMRPFISAQSKLSLSAADTELAVAKQLKTIWSAMALGGWGQETVKVIWFYVIDLGVVLLESRSYR